MPVAPLVAGGANPPNPVDAVDVLAWLKREGVGWAAPKPNAGALAAPKAEVDGWPNREELCAGCGAAPKSDVCCCCWGCWGCPKPPNPVEVFAAGAPKEGV